MNGVTQSLNHWIEVDLDAIAENYALLSDFVAPARVIPVIKANAYGHGIVPVARHLERQGVQQLAVAWVSEALTLRAAHIESQILALGHAQAADARAAVEHSVTLTMDSHELLGATVAAAREFGKIVPVHVKIDTGLHRSGLPLPEAIAMSHKIQGKPELSLQGLWTHMANADEVDDSFSARQLAVFAEAIRAVPSVRFRHVANSATALRRPEMRFEAVRTGIALYGYIPENCPSLPLRPALSLKARVARVVDVRAGEGVSYGLTWKAPADGRVALVPVGYADGWRRGLGNRGAVLIRGQRCPMVGRVCMDQFLVDVSGLDVRQNDEVVLIGAQGSERITATDIAELLDTISWEVLAGLGARIPRIYIERGSVVCP